MKHKFSIVVHGGAGPETKSIRHNKTAILAGLKEATELAYNILLKKGSAVDAVMEAVTLLEDNALFNAGRGAALNNKGQVEMDASIMDGTDLRAGALAGVQRVKNPVRVARMVMDYTNHIILSGRSALDFAMENGAAVENPSYFVTEEQYEEYLTKRKKEKTDILLKKRVHGTVGAVAVDIHGHVAAATSSGGTVNALPGRIGDSCLIGAGCYANNNTCAVSGTGDGEYLIKHVIAHSIADVIKYTGCGLQDACDFIIHTQHKNVKGDMGVIAVDKKGKIGISFNSEVLPRAWMTSDGELQASIHK